MKAKDDNRLRIVGWLISFSILLALTNGIARGEGLYTRTDELSCGKCAMTWCISYTCITCSFSTGTRSAPYR